MRKVITADLQLKSTTRLNITRLKIDENLLWGHEKFKSPGKGKAHE